MIFRYNPAHGGMAEWLKARDSKSRNPHKGVPGFESLSLRQRNGSINLRKTLICEDRDEKFMVSDEQSEKSNQIPVPPPQLNSS